MKVNSVIHVSINISTQYSQENRNTITSLCLGATLTAGGSFPPSSSPLSPSISALQLHVHVCYHHHYTIYTYSISTCTCTLPHPLQYTCKCTHTCISIYSVCSSSTCSTIYGRCHNKVYTTLTYYARTFCVLFAYHVVY